MPSEPNNASVYLAGTGTNGVSSVELSSDSTLDAVNDYYQDGGMLETTDASSCSLVDGKNGTYGTATIASGTLWVDTQANNYGRFNMLGDLSFSGALYVSVQGYKYNPVNPQPGTSDLLYVAGTLTLDKTLSTVSVYTYGTLVKNDFWKVIQSPNNIGGDFSSGSSVPSGQNMTYGPSNNPDPGYYRITFNG